ncbi:MAG: PAS domain-containing protein [Steroidobacteraceae bacterium]|nr:PAS domain-containing protein [Deltaproteobacteria bacterium]
MKSRPSKQIIPHLRVFVIAIIVTIAVGWFLTDFLGRVAEKEFKKDINQGANLTASFLHDYLYDVENAAKALSPSEAIVAALSSGSPADLDRANKTLDRFKSSLEMTVCYLLDRNGLAVASSNRNEANGFVGKSFASRPYFKGALTGRLTPYFALGKLTRERGYFAAAPVIDIGGKITGVVVIKKSVAPIEEAFREDTRAFLVSPEGIIFISSVQELLFRSLWPVAERRRSELLASGQFGSIRFEPLLAAEPRTGMYVSFGNEEHYVHRLPFGSDGWSLVFMEHPNIIANYRLFGILLTMVFGLLLLFFITALLHKDKSLAAAKGLLKAKDDWKRTFDTVPDLIAIIDSNYRIKSMNRAMAVRLGISQEEAVGRRCYELLHGSQEPPSSCPHQRMLDSGRTESGCHFEKSLNGDFSVTAAPILAEDGTVESSVHVMHDVSELKRMERSQKEYAQRLEFVLEGSNDATWELDMITGQCVLNSRFYEMMEFTPGDESSDFAFIMNAIHPDDVDDVQRSMQEHLEGKTGNYEASFRLTTKSGKLKNVMGRGKVVRYDEDGRPTRVAGVTTDVTKMKRLGDEVNRIHNLESIGLLSGGLAHDFNNVLNIIYGNITFVKMLAGDDPAIVEPLTDAEEACERARELGIRLQAISQGSAPAKESIVLSAVFESTAGTLLKDSKISHTIFAAGDILPVEADPRQIRQVVENLLTNAKEAMSDGGTVKVDIENLLDEDKKGLSIGSGHYVCIAIQDTGKGIPEENLLKIFDPYFSTKETYSQRGMGLGLSICHAILKRHGGHISVESELGIGTTVTLYLPASVN